VLLEDAHSFAICAYVTEIINIDVIFFVCRNDIWKGLKLC